MSFAIGLSGAQGGGKSSLLKELMVRGWKLDEFRVSRAVQKQLGWESLDRVMESPETMMAFQNAVFDQKYNNDSSFKFQSCPFTLTERTFADIAAYTTLWTFKFLDQNEMSLDECFSFLTPFVNKCATAQNEVYEGVMLLPLMPHVIWEDDANRAKRADVEQVYETIEAFQERRARIDMKKLVITAESVEGRANQVENFLRTFKR